MNLIVLILIFFSCLIAIFGAGIVIGHLLKLDKFLDNVYNRSQKIG